MKQLTSKFPRVVLALLLPSLVLPGTAIAASTVFSDGFNGSVGNWSGTSPFAYSTTVNHNTYTGAGAAYCAAGSTAQMYKSFPRPFAQGHASGYFYDGKGGWKAGACGLALRQCISLRSGSSVIMDNGISQNGGTVYTWRQVGAGGSGTYTSYATRNAATTCAAYWVRFEITVTPGASTATWTAKVTDGAGATTSAAQTLSSTFWSYGIERVTLGYGNSSTDLNYWDDILFEATTPGSPTIGTPSSITTSGITWNWTAADNNMFGFDVADGSGTMKSPQYSTAGWPNHTARSWAETGLSANTSYTRKVLAWNGSLNSAYSGTATKYTLQAMPTTPTFGTITVNTIALITTGPVNLSGNSGVYFDSTTSGGDGGINAWIQALTDTATGLSPNTQYTFQVMARNGDSVETAYSSTASAWTLSVAPNAGSVTPDNASPCANSAVTWTAENGFGAGKVAKYKYVWDQSPTEPAWTGTEDDWYDGGLQTTPTAAGAWYLHVKGYNGADVENGTYTYSVTANALPTAPTAGYDRGQGASLKIKISDLTSDTIQSLGTAAHGTVSKNDTYIFYVPNANDTNNDSFTYTAANTFSCTKQATINVTVVDATGQAKEITYDENGVSITFAGIPGVLYDVQC